MFERVDRSCFARPSHHAIAFCFLPMYAILYMPMLALMLVSMMKFDLMIAVCAQKNRMPGGSPFTAEKLASVTFAAPTFAATTLAAPTFAAPIFAAATFAATAFAAATFAAAALAAASQQEFLLDRRWKLIKAEGGKFSIHRAWLAPGEEATLGKPIKGMGIDRNGASRHWQCSVEVVVRTAVCARRRRGEGKERGCGKMAVRERGGSGGGVEQGRVKRAWGCAGSKPEA